nr:MAG TPA: hypothetical protein [Crassvirales sp.]
MIGKLKIAVLKAVKSSSRDILYPIINEENEED